LLVEDIDRGDVEPGEHRSCSPLRGSMWTTIRLRSRGRAGFSKTAGSLRIVRWGRCARRHPWSHGPHLDAVGRDHRPMSLAVARRRLADDPAERPAEGPKAHEADVEADV